MNNITRVSDITYSDIASYLRLSDITEYDQNYLTTLINISKEYISKYTGISIENLDNYADFIIVVFVLCQSMYDVRSLYVDNSNLNNVVETILGMHQNNLLPNGEVWVVIQKKQGAPSSKEHLEELFGNCEIITRDKGYYILKSIKHEQK